MMIMPFYEKLIADAFANVEEGSQVTSEGLIKLLNEEFPKHVVPKQTLLDEQAKVKEYKASIADLNTKLQATEGNEDIIKQLQADVEAFNQKEAQAQKDLVLNTAIEAVGGKDKDYIRYLLGDVDLNDQTALTNRLKDLKDSKPSHFEADEPVTEPVVEPEPTPATNLGGYKVLDNGQKNTQVASQEEATINAIKNAFK
ncbi:gp5 [Listeria phage P40]|uniref:gp5 n=1 Tax=Listeria phage P40 TaxID=560178 RepID=UPI00018198BC|nr:gp5 [Listeria phage P40]ACI00365.1 gp5 [Listeria phage P40]